MEGDGKSFPARKRERIRQTAKPERREREEKKILIASAVFVGEFPSQWLESLPPSQRPILRGSPLFAADPEGTLSLCVQLVETKLPPIPRDHACVSMWLL